MRKRKLQISIVSCFSVVLVMSALVSLFFGEDNSHKINALLDLKPNSSYKLAPEKLGEHFSITPIGDLGSFQQCLKSYKPVTWRNSDGEEGSNIELLIDNKYLLKAALSGREVYAFTLFILQGDSSSNRERVGYYSLNCNIDLLNTWSERSELSEIEALNDSSYFKEIYISNDNLTLPVTNGKLGRFYSCMKSYEPFGYEETVAEEGLIKLNLDGGSELQGGHILNLGIKGDKAVSVLIEKYGYRDRTESVSKSYKIDCDLDLLDS
ncbi:hypothetical protein [Pseudoalteromonas sp. G4]|uniref:hypothetical protein n=1 Tax=Pseudoalteromonas sp. G4 TaxID=2992761 RepID=UPI00237D738D|nr:hypothetical protein [Pseudoalteromonas sp. G4]MDE3271891.1 hypothetical protein [Pseudoalteromonas sp. G4]